MDNQEFLEYAKAHRCAKCLSAPLVRTLPGQDETRLECPNCGPVRDFVTLREADRIQALRNQRPAPDNKGKSEEELLKELGF